MAKSSQVRGIISLSLQSAKDEEGNGYSFNKIICHQCSFKTEEDLLKYVRITGSTAWSRSNPKHAKLATGFGWISLKIQAIRICRSPLFVFEHGGKSFKFMYFRDIFSFMNITEQRIQ